MLDASSISVRRINELGIAYGETYRLDDEDVPAAVAEAVETEIVETDADAGEVEVGGRRWGWSRGE